MEKLEDSHIFKENKREKRKKKGKNIQTIPYRKSQKQECNNSKRKKKDDPMYNIMPTAKSLTLLQAPYSDGGDNRVAAVTV